MKVQINKPVDRDDVDALTQLAMAFKLAAVYLETSSAGSKTWESLVHRLSLSDDNAIADLSRSFGLDAVVYKTSNLKLSNIEFPLVGITNKGHPFCAKLIKDSKIFVTLLMTDGEVTKALTPSEFAKFAPSQVFLVSRYADKKAFLNSFYDKTNLKSWVVEIIKANRFPMFEIITGSLFANLLAIAVALFALQVWDRVLPSHSTVTLWGLTIGVLFAVLIEFSLRFTRSRLIDAKGKNIDLYLSNFAMDRVLYSKLLDQPKSKGALVARLKDIDSLRELLTSTVISLIVDIPFVVIILSVIFLLGGYIVVVPIIAILIIVCIALLLQKKFAQLANATHEEYTLRSGLLMESIFRSEDIKITQSELRVRNKWNDACKKTANVSEEQRKYRNLLTGSTASIIQVSYIFVIVTGVYGIFAGELTFGQVLACSILSGRALGPFAQLSAAMSSIQNARIGKVSFDAIAALPQERNSGNGVALPNIEGGYVINSMLFTYDKDEKPILGINSIKIKPGEKVAILGRIGSGKSTLLKLMAGLMHPTQGNIELDGVNITLADPQDLRREVGFHFQDAALFSGSIRDNLKVSMPMATDAQMLDALKLSCGDSTVLNQSSGLDKIINEGGSGLSGGQRQSLLLARTLIKAPPVILLDEPTASFDDKTEQIFVNNLKDWLGDRTFVVSTHRMALLDIVDRLIILEQGKVVMDGAKEKVIAQLSKKAD